MTVFLLCFNIQQGRAAGASFRRITYGCSQILNAADFLLQVHNDYVFCILYLNYHFMKIRNNSVLHIRLCIQFIDKFVNRTVHTATVTNCHIVYMLHVVYL